VGGETVLGTFAAQGTPAVVLAWDGHAFVAAGERVPGERVAAWDDAGHVAWVSDEAEAWFDEARRWGFVQQRAAGATAADEGPPRHVSRPPRVGGSRHNRDAVLIVAVGLAAIAASMVLFVGALAGTMTDSSVAATQAGLRDNLLCGGIMACPGGILLIVVGALIAWTQPRD
jgi:hypothetical protein